jgi:Subtilase family
MPLINKNMSWENFQGAHFGAAAKTPGIDANLVFADASNFLSFSRANVDNISKIPVIVQLRQAVTGEKLTPIQAFSSELNAHQCSVTKIYVDQHKTLFCTAIFTAEYCRRILLDKQSGNSTFGSMVERFELQMPLIPLRSIPIEVKKIPVARPSHRSRKATGDILIGVIDSGCPFAHRSLRSSSGTGTRLIGIWDQDASPAFTAEGNGGFCPPDLGYGCEIRKRELNKVMTRHTRAGVISEDACYESVGYLGMRHRMTHGSAVLDLLAGPLPFLARSSASPDRVASWEVDSTERVHAADIAFVQLPRDAVQDSASAGLLRFLLDGLRYIISFATSETKKIVVNISDGTSRGSHDGSSIFELAMEELISEQRKLGRELLIVVAAGNSRSELRHALLSFDRPKESLTLRLPPGCETAAQLVIRIPGSAKDFKLLVTVPNGQAKPISVAAGSAVSWVENGSTTCSVVVPAGLPGRAICALVAWSPTVSDSPKRAPALAGDWKIAIEGRIAPQSLEDVHFYIARSRTNPGALRRSSQARFLDVDGHYDPSKQLRNLEVDPNPPKSPIRRNGTLNGLGTGRPGFGVLVCGAAYHRNGQATIYSSAGPSAGAAPARNSVDRFMPADESRALDGIRAGGTYSGQSVRVSGTSFAAPQLARWAVNQP